MKKKLLNLLMGTLLSAVMIIPTTAVAATQTHNWAFEMYQLVVNGEVNGQLYSMNQGTFKWEGIISVISKDGGAAATANQTKMTLYRQVDWGIDIRADQFSLTSPSTFNRTIGACPTGVYYITAEKALDDGWNIKGSGTLTSTY